MHLWKTFSKKLFKDIYHWKDRDHCLYTGKYKGAAHGICNLKFNVPNEIPVVFHNGPKFNFPFIVKKLGNDFEGHFECIGENSEKHKSFFVPIKKEIIKIDKECNKAVETTSYKIKFIDSMQFMATSLSNLVDNLTEGIHKIRCKDCNYFLEYESQSNRVSLIVSVKNSLIKYKCLSCNKDYSTKFNKELKKKLKNWERFNEKKLPEKEKFYTNVTTEDITELD